MPRLGISIPTGMTFRQLAENLGCTVDEQVILRITDLRKPSKGKNIVRHMELVVVLPRTD